MLGGLDDHIYFMYVHVAQRCSCKFRGGEGIRVHEKRLSSGSYSETKAQPLMLLYCGYSEEVRQHHVSLRGADVCKNLV